MYTYICTYCFPCSLNILRSSVANFQSSHIFAIFTGPGDAVGWAGANLPRRQRPGSERDGVEYPMNHRKTIGKLSENDGFIGFYGDLPEMAN